VESVEPSAISNAGHSPLKLNGMGFDQFKNDNGTTKEVPLSCRFVDGGTGSLIDKPRTMTRISDSQ